ncbi:transposase [Sphingobacterium multivorum]|nr:transposase [Sphingobacterium multivorum]
MYAKGISTRAISEFICEMYAMKISATEISRITESVLPAVNGVVRHLQLLAIVFISLTLWYNLIKCFL